MPATAALDPPHLKILLLTHSVHKPATQLIKTDQKEFIHSLAHFFKKARDAGEIDEFLERVYNIWFTRWKLTAEDFKDHKDFEDKEYLKFLETKIKKTIRQDLMWYCCCPPSRFVNLNQTWQRYMTFREIRVGIFHNGQGTEPFLSPVATGPRPRPVPMKMHSKSSEQAASTKAAPAHNTQGESSAVSDDKDPAKNDEEEVSSGADEDPLYIYVDSD